MKVLYINILLFSLPLNILVALSHVDYPKNTYITSHTPTTTSRLLCECDIYTSMYDNDPEMKSVMENYNRQTSQRFEGYNKRMNVKHQKCKEQCDKEIQKIVLKDKLQKELTQKISTLETNIDTNDIPTCICKKSLADKTEKFCLNCGCGLGGVAASVGIIGPIAVNEWTKAATVAAIAAAKEAGIQEGIRTVIAEIKNVSAFVDLKNVPWSHFINESNYNSMAGLVEAVKEAMASIKKPCISNSHERVCSGLAHGGDYFISSPLKAGQDATALTTESAKTIKLGEVTNASSNAYAAIGYSITAILIIVLVMIIIYLILRYRRKKKMKKKLQYIKLLKE